MKQQASKLGIISFALFNPCSARYSLYFICRICGLAMALPSRLKGDLVPVCVAVGMIVVSTSLGLYTAMHQLRRAPDVLVRKSRRKTLPEVVEPEHVVDQTKKFITKSFFRKVGHVQDTDLRNRFIPDPSHRDIHASKLHTETLKSVGVDPKLH
ncbi:hypothetical protein RJ640_021434 [Escallonia rubra]|uniref:Transmembrane protein n=1 Tax=Escallonia rubra TaxID=112253 RepID=A0AA88U834_9ASTE|nr:hypothetical protein RJ640_021434 [Escallonia rubra]